MDRQSKAAIIAIAFVIPLTSLAIWESDQNVTASAAKDNSKIVALTSFYPLYDFTRAVGGDLVDVSLLVPAGVEPHDWEPTIQDIQRMQQADIIVINGVGFEEWVSDIDSINSQVLIVDTSQGISILHHDEIIDEHDSHELGDPHIWLNPIMAKIQVTHISDSLQEIDPENKQYYLENTKLYLQKLVSLDSKISKELSSCKKDFIAFHDAFSYFANEYGLNQHTIISGSDPHSEPTSKTLQNIILFAREKNIDVIFTEEAVDQRTSEVIANEIGGRVLTLSPLEIADLNSSYVEQMENNLSNLKEALCN